jgi:hypothetical protein
VVTKSERESSDPHQDVAFKASLPKQDVILGEATGDKIPSSYQLDIRRVEGQERLSRGLNHRGDERSGLETRFMKGISEELDAQKLDTHNMTRRNTTTKL